MRWKLGRRSDNVEDMRGSGGGGGGRGLGGGGLGLGGVAVVVVLSLILGKNPLEMLGLVEQMQGGGGTAQQQGPAEAPPADDETAQFVSTILASTEDIWGQIFQASGSTYQAPKLGLFGGSVDTACGGATSASGPFYCPGDRRVYIDLEFFNLMKAKLGGGGDFAYAYVIAHEVGHHVQTLLGVSDKVNAARQRGQETAGDNGLSVRQELQADCYAGVWGNLAQAQYQWLDDGEVEEALRTASAIGDDTLQKEGGRGRVVPDAFTHGTSEQRVKWFRAGFSSGDPNQCDTFSAKNL